MRTLYLYWEGGQLEVSALVRRGSIAALKGLVSGCKGYEVAAALPLERKQWLFGISPKGAPPALLLVARFSKPTGRDAFVAHLSTFERSARYLANHVLTAVARGKRDRICPKPAAWDLPLEILTD